MEIYHEIEKLAEKVHGAKKSELDNARKIITWVEDWILEKPVMMETTSKTREIIKSDLVDDGKDLKHMMKSDGIDVDSLAIGLAEDMFELEEIGALVNWMRENEVI